MNPGYLQFYKTYSWIAPWRFMWDSLRAPSKARAISLLHRQKDYMPLAADKQLLALHYQLQCILQRAKEHWDSYDYGEGYFYQSCGPVGITGLRDTQARLTFMDLPKRLRGKSVLEIGCNTGFIAVGVADSCRSLAGFDINPFAVEIGNAVLAHLGKTNCHLQVSSFEDFKMPGLFEVVLSFANHSTYDQNTRQSIKDYFQRCADVLAPGGILLFESHPPAYERQGLIQVLAVLEEFFIIQEKSVCSQGSYLDMGRTFVAAIKKEL